MAEDKKKIWKFVRHVAPDDMEDKLNELAEEGYQMFRMDLGNLGYDLAAFNPQLLGAKHAQSMVASMGFGGMVPGPAPGTKVP